MLSNNFHNVTTLEITDLPRYVIWADGFIPEFENPINKGSQKYDCQSEGNCIVGNMVNERYMKSLEELISDKYHDKLEEDSINVSSDLFLITPAYNPEFPFQYTPVHREKDSAASQSNYRLICLIVNDEGENPEFKDAFFESLDALKFNIKKDIDYIDLPYLKRYLHDLSEEMVAPYCVPSAFAEKAVKASGLSCIVAEGL